MKAAADFAYDSYIEVDQQKVYAKLPPELSVAFRCLKFRALPCAGGLRDQPLLLMYRMNLALNVYENVQAYRAAQRLPDKAFGEWASMNSRLIDFMNFIWKLQGVFE